MTWGQCKHRSFLSNSVSIEAGHRFSVKKSNSKCPKKGVQQRVVPISKGVTECTLEWLKVLVPWLWCHMNWMYISPTYEHRRILLSTLPPWNTIPCLMIHWHLTTICLATSDHNQDLRLDGSKLQNVSAWKFSEMSLCVYIYSTSTVWKVLQGK